jgi:hypothetical protein
MDSSAAEPIRTILIQTAWLQQQTNLDTVELAKITLQMHLLPHLPERVGKSDNLHYELQAVPIRRHWITIDVFEKLLGMLPQADKREIEFAAVGTGGNRRLPRRPSYIGSPVRPRTP